MRFVSRTSRNETRIFTPNCAVRSHFVVISSIEGRKTRAVYNKIKSQYGHAYASTVLRSQKESQRMVYMTVIMDFHSVTFHYFQTLWRIQTSANTWFQARLFID